MAADFVSKVEPVNFAMDGLSIRRRASPTATSSLLVKEAGFRRYRIETGLGLGYVRIQLKMHDARFEATEWSEPSGSSKWGYFSRDLRFTAK